MTTAASVLDNLPTVGDLNSVGTVGICVLLVIAFLRGWIVGRREVDDAKAQRDRALDLLEGKTERDEAIMAVLLEIKGRPADRGTS